MQDERIRIFIAIELPDVMRSRLRDFQSGLRRPDHAFVRWVSPGSVHLTLKFLGDISRQQAEQIKAALRETAARHDGFKLQTGACGCFPNVKRARVFWLGLEGDLEKLLKLQQDFDRQTAGLGFPSESRPYTAHLTLARIKDECTATQRMEFGELIRDCHFTPSVHLEVSSIALMQSQLKPSGAVYTRLGEFALRV